jgi:hypothetical protein
MANALTGDYEAVVLRGPAMGSRRPRSLRPNSSGFSNLSSRGPKAGSRRGGFQRLVVIFLSPSLAVYQMQLAAILAWHRQADGGRKYSDRPEAEGGCPQGGSARSADAVIID